MKLEKILAFSNKSNEIVLLKQALFCKVYEESAWQFCKLIKAYKPVKQYIKKLNKEVISIGFPISVLENVKSLAKEKGYEVKQNDNGEIIRINTGVSCEGSFEEWKNSIKARLPIQNNNKQASNCSFDRRKEAIIEKLKEYSLANHTPIETMQFIMQLQRELAEKENAGVIGTIGFG